MTQREVRQIVWHHVQLAMEKAKDRKRFAVKVINFYERAIKQYDAERVADLYSDEDAKNIIDLYGIQAYIDCIKDGNEFVFIGKLYNQPSNLISPIETMISLKEQIIFLIITGNPCDFVDVSQIWLEVYDKMLTE